MQGYRYTNAELRLLREQSGLGLANTLGWLGIVVLIMTGIGGLALAWWAYQLSYGGTILIALAP